MPDRRISALQATVQASQDDLLLLVDDPNGTPVNRKITVATFVSNLSFVTTSSANLEALKMAVTANVSHTGNSVAAAVFTVDKNVNATGNNQYGVVAASRLGAAGANVVGIHAAGFFTVDVGPSANSGNAYGILVDSGKANTSWTRAVAPVAFIGVGEDSPTTNPTQFLLDVGRPSKEVSANTSTGNSSVILSTASSTTITHKLRIRVNGTTYWLALTAAV